MTPARRRRRALLWVAGALVLLPAPGASASPLLAPDDAVTTQGRAVTVPVLQNDTVTDSMRPLLTDSVRLGPAVPGAAGVVGAGRRALTLPDVGTYQVLPGGSVRFTPEPDFVGDTHPVRYSVQDTSGARAGEYLRVRVVRAEVDPAVEAGPQAAIDGEIGANGTWTAPRPPAVPGARTGELPRTGPSGAAVTGCALVVLGAVLRGVPARRPVHR